MLEITTDQEWGGVWVGGGGRRYALSIVDARFEYPDVRLAISCLLPLSPSPHTLRSSRKRHPASLPRALVEKSALAASVHGLACSQCAPKRSRSKGLR